MGVPAATDSQITSMSLLDTAMQALVELKKRLNEATHAFLLLIATDHPGRTTPIRAYCGHAKITRRMEP